MPYQLCPMHLAMLLPMNDPIDLSPYAYALQYGIIEHLSPLAKRLALFKP